MKPPLPPSQFWLEIINVPVVADMIDVHDESASSCVCVCACVCVWWGGTICVAV